MVIVALTALASTAAVDLLMKMPARRARRLRVEHHRQLARLFDEMAGRFDRECGRDPDSVREGGFLDPEFGRELRHLSSYHQDRAAVLQNLEDFDLNREDRRAHSEIKRDIKAEARFWDIIVDIGKFK